MPFTIIRQDITRMQVDAIVNAANTDLAMGGGVCGAIFKAAGPAELQAACDKVAPIKTGGAAITPGFNLPAKFVIHAAGPVYRHWNAKQNEQLLRSAYTESLKLAHKHKCDSIAFPLISSGIYGYPKDEALQVATAAIKDFLADHDIDVYLVIFDRVAFAVSEELLGAVESYIDENYVDTHAVRRRELLEVEYKAISDAMMAPSFAGTAPMAASKGLDDLIDELDEPFNTTLLRLIDAKGKTDAEVYKRANIDRKERYGWEFIFLGANIDAVETAGRFGIDADRAVDYVPDGEGTELNYRMMSETVATFRECGAVPTACLDEIRKDMKKRGGRR